MLPQVSEMDDDDVLSEFSQLFNVDEQELLAEVSSREHASKDQITQAIRFLAQLDLDSQEA